jgi:ketosteroid isomerase-like protein
MSTEVARTNDPILLYRQTFIDAAKAGDIEGMISVADDEVVIMSPNDSTLYGKNEWKEWLEEYFQYFRFTAFTEPERSIVFNGDFATECTVYMIAIAPVGGRSRIRDDGRFLTIWKRQRGGAWKMWQVMWNSTKPIGIGTNRYMWRTMQKKSGARTESK